MAGNPLWVAFIGYFALSSALHENITYQDIIFRAAKFQDLVLKENYESEKAKVGSGAMDLLRENDWLVDPLKSLSEGVMGNSFAEVDSCQNDLKQILGALKEKEDWVLKMIDATGKPRSGIMELNMAWLGRFTECKEIVATKKQKDNSTTFLFKGQYFVASIAIPGFPAGNPALGVPSGLSIGLCVPNSCSKDDIETILKDVVPKNASLDPTVNNYDIGSIPLTASAIVVITLFSLIGFVVLLGTLYDVCLHQPALEKAKSNIAVADPIPNGGPAGERTPLLKTECPEHEVQISTQADQRSVPMRVLLAFSVYSNGIKILSTKRTPGSLDCVHGIRFLSMSWVFLGHAIAFSYTFIDNGAILASWLKRWTFQPIANGTLSVDSFFLLSGTLVSYLLLKQLKNNNGPRNINWALFYFHRFWRLTPVYMCILAFDAVLFRYIGSGPIWPSENGIDTGCEKNWWTNLLYINNFVDPSHMCMAWSWYLANDMQLFIISPVIVIAFYYKWFAGLILSLLLILTNFVTVALLILSDAEANLFTTFNQTYIKPYTRMGPYIVGIMTGYALYITDKNKPTIRKGIVALCWMLAAACNLAVIYGLVDYQGGLLTPPPRHLNAFYQACSRTAWGAGLAWVVFACCRGYGGFVNTLLSWQALIPLSRLTYTAYLTHPIVIYFYNFSLHETIYMNEVVYIWTLIGTLAVTYGVAFVTSLAFESPMMGLEKIVFPRK